MRLVPALSLLALALFPGAQAAALPDLVRTLPNKVTIVVRDGRTLSKTLVRLTSTFDQTVSS